MKRLIIVALMLALAVSPAVAELYPFAGIIVDFNKDQDLVFVEDFDGEVWTFEGVEDWDKGDIVAMMMDDLETEYLYDDAIVSVRYTGITLPNLSH